MAVISYYNITAQESYFHISVKNNKKLPLKKDSRGPTATDNDTKTSLHYNYNYNYDITATDNDKRERKRDSSILDRYSWMRLHGGLTYWV